MYPQRMEGSVIFVIISIMSCLFQLEFECPHKGCKVLRSFKPFDIELSFSAGF